MVGVTLVQAGLAALAGGVLLLAAGLLWPAPDLHVEQARTRLDAFPPVYQFHERHEIGVAAEPARVMQAVRGVTAGEIHFFRALTSLRRFGRPGPESILNAPERLPILDVATRTTFMYLADEPPREVVVGTLVVVPRGFQRPGEPTPDWFRELAAPGFAKAAMNFEVRPDGQGGSLVTTETRVQATSPGARRRFAAYWRVIYPGSALLRRTWLRAIKQRAEAPGP